MKNQLICLVDLEPEVKETVQVIGGIITCKECKEEATLLTYSYKSRAWTAVCNKHADDSYSVKMEELARNPLRWLYHLAEKNDDRMLNLIRYLGLGGCNAIETYKQKI